MANAVPTSSEPSTHIQWMWNANTDPFSKSHPIEWRPYSDADNLIIEEAYKAGQTHAILSNHRIDLKYNLQISNSDNSRQRPVTRIVSTKEEKSSTDKAVPHISNKRIQSELKKLRSLQESDAPVKFILDQSSYDAPQEFNQSEQYTIIGRILPVSDAYRQGAYQIEIKLPIEYPFKEPSVRMITPIYHPSVHENGRFCCGCCLFGDDSVAWKPTTSLVDIVKLVIDFIDHPKLDHVVHTDMIIEYQTNRAEFNRKAMIMAQKHALPRN